MEVQLASASEKSIWIKKYLQEYLRASQFRAFMGKEDTNIIIVKHELQEEAGKTINIPLILNLTGKGVGGSGVLDGNEDDLQNFNCPLTVDWVRNAVRVPKSTSYKTDIDLMGAGKSNLRNWSAKNLRLDIIYAMMAIGTGTGSDTYPYAEITADTTNGGNEIVAGYTPGATFERYKTVQWVSASEAQKDAWLAANSDRVLFGAARSNIASNDHSAALANVDTTTDKLTAATAQLAKRMAQQAQPAINPFMLEDGREYFVMFCGPRSFRDLKTDATIIAANTNARAREGNGMDKNPLFQDGDLIYDGIIFRQVQEIPHITDVGNGSAEVEPNFLCGQGSVGVGWGQEPTPRTDTKKDFEFRPGVAMEELRGVKKLMFNGKQQGIVTVYTAAAGD